MKDSNTTNTAATVSLNNLSETDYISLLSNHAFDQQFSVAVWKLPHQDTRYLILSQKTRQFGRESALEELPAGFLFAPFDRDQKSIFFEADKLFTFEGKQLKPASSPLEINSHTWLDGFLKDAPIKDKKRPYNGTTTAGSSSTIKSDFIDLVAKGIQEIGNGSLEKIVPSRTRWIQLKDDFDVVDTFQKLCDAYPGALISFVSSPETGSWMGASPEALVSVEHGTTFKTVALAGTKPFQEGTNLKNVAWTQKEIEEQALVERYVISCFKKIRVREYDEHGPKTVVAGNLMHLRSDFTVDMKAINFPQLGSVMLQLLHPTSAVCGMPLEPALAFLKNNESHDREYYAGYLGPVNISNSDISIFVNIRCMKLVDNGALLFAGAGVTEDSIADHEWTETEIKCNTLLNVLRAAEPLP